MTFRADLGEVVASDRTGLLGVPSHWERVFLSEVATVLNGFAFPSDGFRPNHGVPLIRIRDIRDTETQVGFIGDYDDRYLVNAGDLLVGMDGDFNVALWKGSRALLNQRVCRISTEEEHYSLRFLSYVLPGYLRAIHARTSSVTVKHLSSRTLAQIPLPLPARDAQERIVAKIEELFSELDAGTEALERAHAKLERYRASVLKSAVEGKLTKQWRVEHPAEETGQELLDRILVERRARWEEEQLASYEAKGKKPPKNWRERYKEPVEPDTSGLPELPEGWCWTTVDQITDGRRSTAYGVLQPGPDRPVGVPLVRVGNVNAGAVSGRLKHIAPATAGKYPRTSLEGGEVLITLVGTIGRTAVVPTELRGANTARAVGVIPLNPTVRPRWLEVWLRSPLQVARMIGRAHEVARKTLNLEDVRSAPVALPSDAEQRVILDRLDAAVGDYERASECVAGAVRQSTSLRQSILKRAFEGRLVPRDPNDEPASVLLERIRAQREAEEPKKQRRTRKSSQKKADA